MTPDQLQSLIELEQACAYHPWSADALRAVASDSSHRIWLEPGAYCIERRILDEAEIHTIGVHPDQRRQGQARRLLERIQRDWTESGISRAFLEVREANTAARGLYRALGWRESGRRADYYGPGEHAICMDWSTS